MTRDGEELTDFDPTGPASLEGLPTDHRVRRFALVVLEGPDAGAEWASASARCSLGTHPSNDLVLADRTVSRFHCEVALEPRGPRVTDVGSRNGTLLDGVRVERAWLRDGSLLRLGQSAVRFRLAPESNPVRLSPSGRFGSMVGRSVPMRAAFAEMALAAASDATILLEGETGTGKEEAAHSIHEASGRARGPFVIVDCSSIPGALLESELFGHERGAFTGADARRDGAFHAATGGTVFLDEIGELPLELQPKVLRVIERRTVRRLGASEHLPVDVRVVAATNRNLRSEVNEGRFRPDLYYRLAVIKIALPPLRERPDDIALLAEHVLAGLGADPVAAAALLGPELLGQLERAAWPGNVRELRNHLERCLVMREAAPPPPPSLRPRDRPAEAPDPRLSYAEARQRALERFERGYLEALLAHHGGNVSKAARTSGMNRAYLYRLLARHGLRS